MPKPAIFKTKPCIVKRRQRSFCFNVTIKQTTTPDTINVQCKSNYLNTFNLLIESFFILRNFTKYWSYNLYNMDIFLTQKYKRSPIIYQNGGSLNSGHDLRHDVLFTRLYGHLTVGLTALHA